jgi:Tfp pilus assembly protein PilV
MSMHTPSRRLSRLSRGISLIEALVALAIMAIGMLGIVGMQSTLRSTSDVSKQRSEAVRIAQREIERWRAFLTISGNPTTINYDDLLAGTTADPPFDGINASYTLSRTVSLLPLPRLGKALGVSVTWEDRTGQPQRVDLSTMIAGISPELSSTLTVPGAGDVIQQTQGRKGGIPIGAKDLGGGRSGWIPPGATPGVAWVFNNATGVITLCTTTATAVADLIYDTGTPGSNNVVCTTNYAMYVSGFLRYALDYTQPTPANAANPPSQPADSPAANLVTVQADYTLAGPQVQACYVSNVNSGSPFTPSYTQFNCAVPALLIPNVPLSWTGSLKFGPATLFSTSLSESAASLMKACRYHAAASYAAQTEPLANQNFLLIRSGDGVLPFTCPTPPPPLLYAHQPAI